MIKVVKNPTHTAETKRTKMKGMLQKPNVLGCPNGYTKNQVKKFKDRNQYHGRPENIFFVNSLILLLLLLF